MTPTRDTIDRIKNILRTSLRLDGLEEFDDAMPLIGGDYDLDSLDILLLITNIEKEFGVRIRDGEMDRATFASISTLAERVERIRQEP